MIAWDPIIFTKSAVVFVFYSFLPITAITYYLYRRSKRTAEVERIFSILNITHCYKTVCEAEKPGHFFGAVAYASLISLSGLIVLFMSPEIESLTPGSLAVNLSGVKFPNQGSSLVFGMAVLGAYLLGVQHIFRRYALNDLRSSVYYGLSIRMLMAGFIALVIYNGYSAFAGGSNDKGVSANIWPAMAFLIGIFPQRGLRWLTEKVPMVNAEADPSTRKMPLERIEGIEAHDILRLEELGIDTCYDLANADFIPLVLKTPYSARQLIDWILQAKLCVCFGDAVKDMRQHGIRTIADLEHLTLDALNELPQLTSVTKDALHRAKKSNNDEEIKRLREAGQLLSVFWNSNQDIPAKVKTGNG